MVESSFENKLILSNGSNAKEIDQNDSLVATYCSSAVDFVQKPRTLYSSNALRRVVPVKDLSKKKESLTMSNIKMKGAGGLQGAKSRLFQSMENVEGTNQVQRFRSCSYIANQVSFRSPRGTEFGNAVHRSINDSLGANDIGNAIDQVIEEKKQEEEDSTESEDETSSDGGSDSSIDAALDGDENEEAMYKKLQEAQEQRMN